jgi:fibro-slime domain-containing protein
MRSFHPLQLGALLGALLVLACSSPNIIPTDPSGSGGSYGDAATYINLDAIQIIRMDGRPNNPNRVGSDAPPGPNCGNGQLTSDEACDDGNNIDGDGCANNCLSVESGWSCVKPGEPCRPVARCGDGLAVFPEQCDDGNLVVGDGCSDICKIEIGYKCDTAGQPCTHTTCGDGKIEGAESCEDGNNMPFDGCSSDCQNEPNCTASSGACTSRCGDGIVFSNEQCDDANNIDGDGCSSDCKAEQGFKCTQPDIGEKMLVPVVYRDFRYHSPSDFEAGVVGSETATTGLVKGELDGEGKPVYTNVTGGAVHIEGEASFKKWYRNTDGTNHPTPTKLALWNNGKDAYVNRYGPNGEQYYITEDIYFCGNVADATLDADGNPIPCTFKYGTTDCDKAVAAGKTIQEGSCKVSNGSYVAKAIVDVMDGNPTFFPVDGDDFTPASERVAAKIPPYYDPQAKWPFDVDEAGNNRLHNFSFTSEVRYWFKFEAGKTYTLDFVGDDDVWVFINKKLAVDLGGIHTPVPGSVTINNTTAGKYGITDGNVYEAAVFQAERQTEGSSYKLTLSGFNAAPSNCVAVCGDGILAIGEECDDGPNNGTDTNYGSCSANCTMGAFCGDGLIQAEAGEECDDGGLNGTAPDKCPTGCRHLFIP